MPTSIVPFDFESHTVRTVTGEDGEPLFVAKDVAVALGFKDPTNAIKQHCKGVVNHHPISDSMGRTQEARIIREPDVYRLVIRSNLPEAQRFEKWLFEEVLPSIRKTGKYAVAMTASEIILLQAQQLVELERKQAEQADQLKRLEAKQEAFEKGINDFSIVAYCGYKGYPAVNMEQAQRLGKAAAKLCRESGLPIGKVRDPRFGFVNTYQETVLEEVFAGELEF